jgi:uncharacterized membrane protein YoaK (UPF0700 family)
LASRPTQPSGTRPTGAENAGLLLGFALLALAGWVDAVGLVQWDGLYASFMSGNTTQFGASPAIGDWQGTWEAGRAIVMFLVGIVAAETVAPAAGSRRSAAVLTVEAALLWLAAGSVLGGWGDAATVSIAGLAMGVQTAALHKAKGVGVPLTYVTGTLVNLGRAIAAALRGDASWSKALPFAGFWLSLCGGAVAGSFAARAGLAVAMVAAAGIASALALFAGVAVRRDHA